MNYSSSSKRPSQISETRLGLSFDLEPRPLAANSRIVLVEEVPLIDPAWIQDETLFRCLEPLLDHTSRQDEKIHPGRISGGTFGAGNESFCQVKQSKPPFNANKRASSNDVMTNRSKIARFDDNRDRDFDGRLHWTESDGRAQGETNLAPYQSDQWTERFNELVEFHREFGHCVVPYHYPNNSPLALWVARQRHQYHLKKSGLHSTMTDERQKSLEDLGFVWDSRKAIWEGRLNELILFRNRMGHCNVPSTFEGNSKLAAWVKCQRRQYKLYCSGKKSNITEDRIAKLTEAGFSWDPRGRRASSQGQSDL